MKEEDHLEEIGHAQSQIGDVYEDKPTPTTPFFGEIMEDGPNYRNVKCWIDRKGGPDDEDSDWTGRR